MLFKQHIMADAVDPDQPFPLDSPVTTIAAPEK